MKKRIAFFLASLRGGGAEKSVVHLANYYIENGVDVDIVLVQKIGPYLKDLHSNIRIIDLNKNRSFNSILALRSYLLEVEPDVLMSSVIHTNLVTIFSKLLLFKRCKTRIVVNQVNHMTMSMTKRKKINGLHILKFKLIAFLYSLSDGVICMSKGVMKDLLSYGSISKHCIVYIYNPVVTGAMINYSTNSSLFEKITFLGVGRLEEQKHFSLLIDAFSIVKQSVDAQLIILGEGSLRGDLINQVQELGLQNDVHLAGFVDNPFSYMKRADTFVLSSLWEGFGNVVAESLALGMQVVSTDCPSGPSEILCGGDYGQLVPMDNVEALSVAMLKSVNCPIAKNKLIERSKDFLVNKIAIEYQNFLLK
jgi:glycosyltransferase involved in cell wall biosynthesis